MPTQIETLGDALPKEIARNKQLIEQYKSIGTAGNFGIAVITADINAAETAISTGDIIQMIRSYETLKNNQ